MASAENRAVLKPKKEKASKSKYNALQNTWFMIKLAWASKEKKVLVLSLLAAGLALANNLINLYVSPSILAVLEKKGSIPELLWTIAAFTLGIMFLSASNAYMDRNIFFGRITVRCELTALLNNKNAATSYPNIDDENFKKVYAKARDATSDNDSAGEALWVTLTELTTNILGFIIYVNLLTAVSPLLLLVVIMTTAIGYFFSNYINGYGYRHREEEERYLNEMGYFTVQSSDWNAAKDIRIFGLRPWLEELYTKAINAYMSFHRRAEGVYIWARIADVFLSFLRSGIAYAYLIVQVTAGKLGVAEFLLYFTAISGFTEWVTGILSNCITLHKQSLDISTIRECLEYPEPFRFEDGKPLNPMEHRAEIRLEDVSFRYPGAEKDTLSHINLTLRPGENLAVVGLNGAGKTTLVKLICGFLDPTEGRVLLDGEDIRQYNRRDYYNLFSAVFQNFTVLAGTIALNIAQRERDIDMRRVKECAEKAGLRQKIESLPDGYDTFLERQVYHNAIMLSGGETQRLMLARSLYKDVPFIILDEPTAALDPIAESDMYQKYSEMTSGKTSVYISHRLASTRFCDWIIMIDNGGIREQGTHDQLLKQGGKYAELFEIQSKYYREGENHNEKQ